MKAAESGSVQESNASTQTATAGEGSAKSARNFRLFVARGDDAGRTFASKGERVVIGSHESVDLVLSDPTVSRFHCELVFEADRVVLRDLGSRNGTVLNGVEVHHAYPHSGSVLRVGRSEIRFDVGSEGVEAPLSERERFGSLVGKSVPMRRVFARLERAAESDATVLIEGETGTGKELAAESLHTEGRRRDGPFVVVDCGALPHDLLESELFGHVRGAFTGAIGTRHGALEAASSGTVFLDEIGELALDLQPKLLRALERREIKAVGGNQYLPIDVRIVAATNRNLRAAVNSGIFRSDLYYRLAVVEVKIPPLREHLDDLQALVETMLPNQSDVGHEEARSLCTPAFFDELRRHSWPGNVRELRNYVERCLALRESAPISSHPGQALPALDAKLPLREARERWTHAFERRYLDALLQEHGDNVSAAARAAGIARIHLYRLLWRHGLR